MKLKLGRSCAARVRIFTWDEIIAGVKEGWLDPGVAVDYAIRQMRNGNSEDTVHGLAGCSYSDPMSIQDYLEQMEADKPVLTIANKKWAMIMLALGFEQRVKLLSPLQFVEEIYAEYDYVPEISHLVRYMPADGSPRNLMVDWEQFINEHVYDVLIDRLS